MPVFLKTLSLTRLINLSKSSDFAFPLLIKKLECCLEILASPILSSAHPELSISFQALLFLGFLNVLPHVLIFEG